MTTPWLFAACIGLLMAFVAFTTYRSGQLLRYWTPPENLLLGVPDNLIRLALVGLCGVLGVTLGPGPMALGWSTANLGADLAWGTVIGLLMTGILTGVGWAVERRWGAEVAPTRLIRCILPINRREWAGVMAALLPAAALEELLFRSLPLGGLTWIVEPWWLMWPLALFFGLLHWPQGAWGVVGTTCAAIILSLLFLATGSIWAVLAAHYVFNVMQLVAAHWMGLQPLRAAEPISAG